MASQLSCYLVSKMLLQPSGIMIKNTEHSCKMVTVDVFSLFSYYLCSYPILLVMFTQLNKKGWRKIEVKQNYRTHISSSLKSKETRSCFSVYHYHALNGVCVYMMWGGGAEGFIRRPLSSCCSICKVWSVIILSHYCDLESWAWGARWDPSDNTVTQGAVENTNT